MKNLKKWFEERYLDGNKMQDGQFISSKECFEAIEDALAEREKKIVEKILSIEIISSDIDYELAQLRYREKIINLIKNNERN